VVQASPPVDAGLSGLQPVFHQQVKSQQTPVRPERFQRLFELIGPEPPAFSQVFTHDALNAEVGGGNAIGPGQAAYEDIIRRPGAKTSQSQDCLPCFIVAHRLKFFEVKLPSGDPGGSVPYIFGFLPRKTTGAQVFQARFRKGGRFGEYPLTLDRLAVLFDKPVADGVSGGRDICSSVMAVTNISNRETGRIGLSPYNLLAIGLNPGCAEISR